MAIGTGNGPPDLEAGMRLAERYPFLYATVGVHPHDASKASREMLRASAGAGGHPKVVAIGEIGLDYHYDFSPRPVQRAVFERQLEIAAEAGKPVVIHTREAWEDTLALLVAPGRARRRHHALLHRRRAAGARRPSICGFYLAFGGVLTFPKADAVRRGGAHRRPRTGCWWRRIARTWRPCRTAANATSRPSWWRWCGAWRRFAAVRRRRWRSSPRAISNKLVCRAGPVTCTLVTCNESGQGGAGPHGPRDFRPHPGRTGRGRKEDHRRIRRVRGRGHCHWAVPAIERRQTAAPRPAPAFRQAGGRRNRQPAGARPSTWAPSWR